MKKPAAKTPMNIRTQIHDGSFAEGVVGTARSQA
jgi:hypothetical protein